MSKSSINILAKKINDSQGRKKTLSHGVYSFVKLDLPSFNQIPYQEKQVIIPSIKKKILFLGLGYNTMVDAINISKNAEQVYYIECEDFEKACAESNILLIQPEHFIKLTESKLYNRVNSENYNIDEWDFLLYKQNISLFPRYWNNILIKLEELFTKQYLNNTVNNTVNNDENGENGEACKNDGACKDSEACENDGVCKNGVAYENSENNKKKNENGNKNNENTILQKKPSIFIAGSSHDLMHKELCVAVTALGYECLTSHTSFDNYELETKDILANISHILREKRPSLFLSINGRNLDSTGKTFYTLQQLNIPVALWIADNPWNILSNFKEDWWKDCQIYLTDDSFIPMIKSHGASKVYHLPLAGASTYNMQYVANVPPIPFLYVGHSSFKNKEKFFSAVYKNEEIFNKYKQLVDEYFKLINNKKDASIIDFHQIYNLVYPTKAKNLWPGNDFRTISYLASETDNYQKTYWLNTLSQHLTLVGDDGWKKLLNNIDILPPVDYYTQLPAYYAKAKFTLNITSLLMPNALTQRHFDVWLSGGFLLSSPTDGMKIFDTDITNLITTKTPQTLLMLKERYTTKANLYKEIQSYISNSILTDHLYSHRLKIILQHI